MSFAANLGYGKAAEGLIANWFRKRGWAVLPVYEKTIDEGKGPQIFLPQRELIAPDLLVFRCQKNNAKTYWVEAKHKTAFSWHRLTRRWVTGIDLRHYRDYCQVDDMTPWPVWLLFLHDGGQAKDSPEDSPAGLFGNKLASLRRDENHRSPNWGHSGMVYWTLGSLIKLADISELRKNNEERKRGVTCLKS